MTTAAFVYYWSLVHTIFYFFILVFILLVILDLFNKKRGILYWLKISLEFLPFIVEYSFTVPIAYGIIIQALRTPWWMKSIYICKYVKYLPIEVIDFLKYIKKFYIFKFNTIYIYVEWMQVLEYLVIFYNIFFILIMLYGWYLGERDPRLWIEIYLANFQRRAIIFIHIIPLLLYFMRIILTICT